METLIVKDYIDSPSGKIPRITPFLTFKDHLGTFKVRMSISRMDYLIQPGLYAIGNPDSKSPVLVTANYKMSFDYLRRELINIDAWILVLDTKGINVWCAAGKGTFGTDEVIKQVQQVGLHEIVTHRKLILPQLGAPGVAAHLVRMATDFKIIYGPVRAADLPAFLKAGMKATPEMRKVHFNFRDRLTLVPVEIAGHLKYTLVLILIFMLLSGLNRNGYTVNLVFSVGLSAVGLLLVGLFSGTIGTPLLLPYVPGRAFALKGFLISTVIFLFLILWLPGLKILGVIELVAWFLIISAISSFTAMNFTGASTFTSLSGVKKEMHYAVPLQIGALSLGSILWLIKRFI